jgi:hypothetical protein
VFFGIRAYRDNVGRGQVSFLKAFQVGILIAIISSACYVATWEVIYFNVMPDFMEKYSAHVIDQERAKGATDAALEARRKELEKYSEMYRNPFINVAMTFAEPFPVGLIVTLVSAGILSRRRRPELAPA